MDVATGVATRSLVTASLVALLVVLARVPWRFNRQQGRGLLFVGLMIGVQSQCLYAAVARLPVALALLAFNTYPLWTALWDKLIYKRTPQRSVLLAMPLILLGLAIALDVLGAASGLGAQAQWAKAWVLRWRRLAVLAWPWCAPNMKQRAWTVGCVRSSVCYWPGAWPWQ
jgi:drug/metabolite transporter (DMT)-like permease